MSARAIAIALLAALALFVAVDNVQRPLANPDEGRYSEISREMAATGDWVTPRLNALTYFEKPPLQYWASALALRLLGEREWVARLYTALCAFLALGMVAFTARRLAGGESALLAAGVLISSPYFMGLAGVVTLDMGLTAWTTLAVCAFLLGQTAPESERRHWMRLAWAGMALAVLSKGLIGIVFPAAAVFLYCLANRDWRRLAGMQWLPGLAIFLALAAPWFVLVSQANPEFARFFFVHEHFERFLTKAHRREEAWWYFGPILLAGFLPWAIAVVPAAVEGWRRESGATGFRWRRFAILWSVFILAFFSASGSKLPAYILPVFPVFALVLGDNLARADPRRLWKHFAILAPLVAAGAVIAWGLPDRARTDWMREMHLAARPWMVAGIAVLAAGLAAGAWRMRAGRKGAALALVVAASLAFIDLVEDGYERLSPRQSGLVVARAMRPHLRPETRLYSVETYDQSLPFYIGRTLTLVQYRDEFGPGIDREPALALPTVADFERDWVRPGEAMAIIQPDAYETLAARGLAMTLLYRDERRALVRKP